MSGYFKKPVLSVVASALGLVLLCACAGTKTVTPSGAVSASITASTSAAAAASSTTSAATLPSADPRRDYTKAEEATVFNWCVKHANEAKTFTLSQVPKLNNQPFWVCVILNDGAGAVDVQLPSTREVNTYATDGVIPPGCSKQTATDQGRKVFLISNGQIWQGRAELVCSPDMAAYPTPVSTW
jgi:lipoprotein